MTVTMTMTMTVTRPRLVGLRRWAPVSWRQRRGFAQRFLSFPQGRRRGVARRTADQQRKPSAYPCPTHREPTLIDHLHRSPPSHPRDAAHIGTKQNVRFVESRMRAKGAPGRLLDVSPHSGRIRSGSSAERCSGREAYQAGVGRQARAGVVEREIRSVQSVSSVAAGARLRRDAATAHHPAHDGHGLRPSLLRACAQRLGRAALRRSISAS